MRLPAPRQTRRLRAELAALAHVGGEAINDWRAEHPDQPLRLDRTKLVQVDLRAANLAGTNLAHADLSQADLSAAKLLYADLEGARGLTPVQLAGCNLAGARLPDSINAALRAPPTCQMTGLSSDKLGPLPERMKCPRPARQNPHNPHPFRPSPVR